MNEAFISLCRKFARNAFITIALRSCYVLYTVYIYTTLLLRSFCSLNSRGGGGESLHEGRREYEVEQGGAYIQLLDFAFAEMLDLFFFFVSSSRRARTSFFYIKLRRLTLESLSYGVKEAAANGV